MKRPRAPAGKLLDGRISWQRVALDDSLFVGSDVGGFVELEELALGSTITSDQPPGPGPAKKRKAGGAQEAGDGAEALSTAAAAAGRPAKLQKGRRAGQHQGPEPAAVDALLPHLHQQAHAEQPAAGQAADGQPSSRSPEKKKKRSRILEAQGAQPQPPGASKAAAAAEPPSASQESDTLEAVSKAWGFCGLHPQLLATLAAQGFLNPTPIQQRCLPSAIWGRKDIVGAAQTVRHRRLSCRLLELLHAGAVASRLTKTRAPNA